MEFLLLGFLIVHPILGYLIIGVGLMVEGDLMLFTAAFLAHLGVFKLPPLLLLALISVLLGDILWYALGGHQKRLPPKIIQLIERLAAPFDEALTARPLRTFFITKFMYCIHHLVVARAGADKLGFSRFLKNDLLATLGWLIIIAAFGYLSGYSLSAAKEYLRFAEVGIAIGIAALFFLEKLVRRHARW